MALRLDRELRLTGYGRHDFPNEPQLVRILAAGGQKPSFHVVGSVKQEDAYSSIIDDDSDLRAFKRSILDNPDMRDIGMEITPVFMGAFSNKPQTKGGASRLFTPVQPLDMIYDTRRYIACQIAGPDIDTESDTAAVRLALIWQTMKVNPSPVLVMADPELTIDRDAPASKRQNHAVDGEDELVMPFDNNLNKLRVPSERERGSDYSGLTSEMRKAGLQRAADTGLIMQTRAGMTAYFPASQFASEAALCKSMKISADVLRLDVMPQELHLQPARFAIAA